MAYLNIKPNGDVDRVGVEQPIGKLHEIRRIYDKAADTYSVLVFVKVPGHQYWAARGTQKYAGAEIQIFRIRERVREGIYLVWEFADVPVRGNDPEILFSQLKSFSNEIIPGNQETENA